jgi:hypothetical protein
MAGLNAESVESGIKDFMLEPKDSSSSLVADVCNEKRSTLALQSPRLFLCGVSYRTFLYL